MTFKKMMLVAGMALAAIAFAVPASASALPLEWTHNGAEFQGDKTDTLTGQFSFGNPAPGQSKFGCPTHIPIFADGGTTTATMENFIPTTGTCAGEGSFTGCTLLEDSVTGLSANTNLHNEATNEITLKGVSIVVHTVFDAACPIEKSTWTRSDLSLGVNNSNLTDVTVSGLMEAHTTIRATGQELTQTVAVFGTFRTATDTLSIR